MKFDDILNQIGGFGRYQKIKFTLAALPAAVIALHQLASVFLAATPDFSCDNGFSLGQNLTSANISEGRDACFEYGVNESTSSQPCTRFTYSQEYFYRTIVTDWDLVCENKYKSTISTMVYMAGKLAGAFIFGLLSDYLGRKKTVLISFLLLTGFGLGAAFSPDYYTFTVLRFLIGACATGMYMCLFVLGMELIGTHYRVVAGIGICYFFALGYVLLAAIAYLTRNWVYTQIVISAPVALFLSYYWFLPESARWLLSRNRVEEAKEIILHAADVNKVTLPKDFSIDEEKAPTSSLRSLCSASTLLCRSLIIFLNWFAVAMGYYGLSLSSVTLGGNSYINFMLSGAVEFVAYTACFTINKLGRKGPHIFGMLVAGLACLGTVLVDLLLKDESEEDLTRYFVALNIVGKFGMTMGFAIIYIWSAEVYPTSLRTSLMGLSSMVGRVGQILAPFIADIGNFVPEKYSKMLPAAIFGCVVIISGLLTIALPETSGHDLPETVEEANVFPRIIIKSGEESNEEKQSSDERTKTSIF